MRVITISREFGSGGRELGKRLAEALNIPYYDQQILDLVAEKENVARGVVEGISEKDMRSFYPMTIARGFANNHYTSLQSAKLLASEHEIIKSLAKKGDCVIVGRAADVVLAGEDVFSIFVCANAQSKLARCHARAQAGEVMTDKEMLRKCREIDKRRASYRGMFTDKKWGDASGYHLCVNTSGKEIKALVPAIADYVEKWFAEGK